MDLTKKLLLDIWDYDFGSKDDFIGFLEVSLQELLDAGDRLVCCAISISDAWSHSHTYIFCFRISNLALIALVVHTTKTNKFPHTNSDGPLDQWTLLQIRVGDERSRSD